MNVFTSMVWDKTLRCGPQVVAQFVLSTVNAASTFQCLTL